MGTNPLSAVDSWLYHLGDIDSDSIFHISFSDADLVVTEFANYEAEETPYTTSQLDAMRGDTGKLIVSYLSIGEAEDYRFYWDSDEFLAIRDTIIDNENPEWEGNFKVRYWDEDWQDIIFDYVDRIIDAGFNGLYLDIIDAYEYWEETAPNSGIDYRQEMAEFVARIKLHAETRLLLTDPDRDFVIIGQNGEDLIENPIYLAAIDGIGKEDLQFYYENTDQSDLQVQDEDAVDWSLAYLLAAEAAGVEVFSVEYLYPSNRWAQSQKLGAIAEILEAAGIPLYVAENRDLDAIFKQPLEATIIDRLVGTDGADILRGDFGKDILMAGGGNDQIWAGAGDAGDDLFTGGAGDDTIGGGIGHDFLIGGGADDGAVLDWLPDNDNSLLDGADVLFGGSGDDTILGGGWDDNLVSDDGLFDAGEAIISGTDANAIWAGLGNDWILAAAGSDELGGAAGDDTIEAFAGNDTLYGSLGLDLLDGGDGDDRAFGGAGDGSDTLLGGAGNDILFGGQGADIIDGGTDNDELYGGGGDDDFQGGAGDDTLWAGPGDDQLTGGLDADLFAFVGDTGDDTITDFDPTEDILDLSGLTSSFADFSALQSASSNTLQDDLSGLLIDLGEGNSLFLQGLSLTSLSETSLIL